ncbi:amidohydrolase [Sanguibacter sp. 25GB23B1]|uniref:amidohydrolase n=1 Tax=unclassified Sanguibacter TaxID=2645534 RepID=UPI0032AED49C
MGEPAGLAAIYQHLHENPELSFDETATAALVAAELDRCGFDTTTGVGVTGVVGVLRNGPGPTVLLRADMDALPVEEQTGLAYASTARATDPHGRDVPVMHACGHDMHVTCLIGASRSLALDRDAWSGTLVVVFQPAEELGTGARAMIEDGVFDRFPRPDVVLGQHVSPLPAGTIGLRSGPAFAASDALRITVHGRGGHGSRPEVTIDPIVIGASIVTRLQTIVSREVAGTDVAVLTVGAFHAGFKENIIPDSAELSLSVRTFEAGVRDRVLAAIHRVAAGEAAAGGAIREPDVVLVESFPAVVNSSASTDRVRQAFTTAFGTDTLVDPGLVTGSEDVGLLASAAGAECVYWLLGGADPSHFAAAQSTAEVLSTVRDLPSNHSPLFAPTIEPTLTNGVATLTTAALAWLAPPGR